jgi:hypothetical protein
LCELCDRASYSQNTPEQRTYQLLWKCYSILPLSELNEVVDWRR